MRSLLNKVRFRHLSLCKIGNGVNHTGPWLSAQFENVPECQDSISSCVTRLCFRALLFASLYEHYLQWLPSDFVVV